MQARASKRLPSLGKVPKVWSGLFRHQRHSTHLKHPPWFVNLARIDMTPDQRRKNKRTGLIFLVIVVVLFVWVVFRKISETPGAL
uniref:cytochrome oxidase small assembly protein n=1 Tax=Orrella sp. TaxID=1921583 RepID=UPI0040484532